MTARAQFRITNMLAGTEYVHGVVGRLAEKSLAGGGNVVRAMGTARTNRPGVRGTTGTTDGPVAADRSGMPDATPDHADDAEWHALLAYLQADLETVEAICRRYGARPADLPAPSYRAYQWTRFLNNPENLALHVETVARLTAAVRNPDYVRRLPAPRRPLAVSVRVFHAAHLYRIDWNPGGTRLGVHEGFLGAPGEVVNALVLAAFERKRDSRHLAVIREYSAGAAFAQVTKALARADVADLAAVAAVAGLSDEWGRLRPEGEGGEDIEFDAGSESYAHPYSSRFPDPGSQRGSDPHVQPVSDPHTQPGSGPHNRPGTNPQTRPRSDPYDGRTSVFGGQLARGAYFDLAEVFVRVNRRYFGGDLGMPRLIWSYQLTRRKLGHYQFATDTVMISRSLDGADVPAYVVEFVMYHELLHKHMGVKVMNGRRYAHTPEFRAAERRFGEYAVADAWLKGLAERGGKVID